MAAVTWDTPAVGNLAEVVLYTGPLAAGHGSNRVNVQGTAGGLTAIAVQTGDTVTVGSQAPALGGTLAGIQGSKLTIETAAGTGAPTVILDDSGNASTAPNPRSIDLGSDAPNEYVITSLAPSPIGLILAPTAPVSIRAGSALATTNEVFRIHDFVAAPALSLVADGGNNTLDYSAYTGTVKVILPAGKATGFAGISKIQNVTGGIGNNLLVGDAGANVLIGGTGRNRRQGSHRRQHPDRRHNGLRWALGLPARPGRHLRRVDADGPQPNRQFSHSVQRSPQRHQRSGRSTQEHGEREARPAEWSNGLRGRGRQHDVRHHRDRPGDRQAGPRLVLRARAAGRGHQLRSLERPQDQSEGEMTTSGESRPSIHQSTSGEEPIMRRRSIEQRKRARSNGLSCRYGCPPIEVLERRLMLSLVTWTGKAGDGDGNNPAHWEPNGMPGRWNDTDLGGIVTHSRLDSRVHSIHWGQLALFGGKSFVDSRPSDLANPGRGGGGLPVSRHVSTPKLGTETIAHQRAPSSSAATNPPMPRSDPRNSNPSASPLRRLPVAPGETTIHVPGHPGQSVTAILTLIARHTALHNEVGLFLVDDTTGRIGRLRPGDRGPAPSPGAVHSIRESRHGQAGRTAGRQLLRHLPDPEQQLGSLADFQSHEQPE
jgi:hypothetical protein